VRRGLSRTTAELVGTPVTVAVPLQRHHPALILGVCVAELATFAGALLLDNLAAFAVLAALAIALVVLAATNRRRVLAVTSMGMVQLAASLRGRPSAVVGPAADVALPTPTGLGCRVELDGRTWWVERAAYPRLARARETLTTGDESPESGS
jgi:hypothetical protein